MGRAIVREAEAFLFDEPLSNLDAKLRGQMRTEIARMQRRLGTTTVYVTHDQTEAMTLGDRVAVLRKGVLQQVAAPRELYEQPVNLFVAGFIGSPPMNFLPGEVDGSTLRAAVRRRPSSARLAAQAGGQGDRDRRHPARALRGRRPARGGQAGRGVDVHAPGGRHRVAGQRAVRLHPVRGARRRPRRSSRSWPRPRRRAAAHPAHRHARVDEPDPRGRRRGALVRHPQDARVRPRDRREPHLGRRGRGRADPLATRTGLRERTAP